MIFTGTRVSGYAVMAWDLNLTSQFGWQPYGGGDAPEGGFMGWMYSGTSEITGVINLPHVFATGTYYVNVKTLDYNSPPSGRVKIVFGNGTNTGNVDYRNWDRRWNTPIQVQTTISTGQISIIPQKVGSIETTEKQLLLGIYITTQPNERGVNLGGDSIADYTRNTGLSLADDLGVNLIPNSSFEIGFGNGYGFSSIGGERDYTIQNFHVSGNAFHGNYFIRFPTSGYIYSRIYNVRSKQHTLSAYIRGPAGSPNVTMYLGSFYTTDEMPPGLTGPSLVASSKAITTNWVRHSLTGDLITYPNDSYQFYIYGHSGIEIDAIQLEEGPITNYRCGSHIESKFVTDKTGNLLLEDESLYLILNSYCSSGGYTGNLTYNIYNLFNENVQSGYINLNLSSGQHSGQQISVTGQRGIFRAVSYIEGISNTMDELSYAVIPRALSGSSLDSSFGVHPNFTYFQLERYKRMGINWARVLSPAAFFRWYLVEPTEGNFIWYDEKVGRAVSGGWSILGSIGTNNYWPAWAASGNYFNLSQWGTFCYKLAQHYSGLVNYWEIWNEARYTFTDSFYSEMLYHANTGIRRGNPNAKIVGLGGEPIASSSSIPWVTGVFGTGTGVTSLIDYAALHHYPDPTSANTGTSDGVIGFKTAIIDVYGKEFWNTEAGAWDEGFYKTSNSIYNFLGEAIYPNLYGSRYSYAGMITPEIVMENVIFSLGNGVSKYFYYDGRITLFPEIASIRSHPTMLEYDDTIRPKGIAYSIGAHFLDYSTGLGKIISGRVGEIHGYLFNRTGIPTVALWAANKTRQYTIQLSNSGWRAYNIMGNSINFTGAKIPFGRSIVYVQSNFLSVVEMSGQFRSGVFEFSNYTDYPNLTIDHFPLGTIGTGISLDFRWYGLDKVSVPDQLEQEGVKYSYKLNDYNDWSNWYGSTVAFLNDVPDGDYQFQVKAINKSGIISPIVSTPTFTVGRGRVKRRRNRRLIFIS